MRFAYRGFTVETTPEFSVGRFFANARIVRGPLEDEIDGEAIEMRDLGQFDDERSAEAFGRSKAIEWIEKRHSELLTNR